MAAAKELYIGSDNLVSLEGLKNQETGAYVNDATVTVSVFEQVALHPDCSELTFTSGGTAELVVGDVVIGATGGATAEVKSITLSGGTWAGGDAAGRMEIIKQRGIFEAENLNQRDGQANIATIAADSTGAESANAGSKTKIRMRDHGLRSIDYVYIQGSQGYDGEYAIDAVEDGKITIPAAYVAEKFTGDELIYVGVVSGVNISLSYVAASNGNYQGILPDTMKALAEAAWYWIKVVATKDTTNLVAMKKYQAIFCQSNK